MKKLFILMLALSLLLGMTGCGESETPDPNAGVYEAVSATGYGMTLDVSAVFPDGFSLTLKNGGKATFHYDKKDYGMKWSLDGEVFHAEGGGAKLDGTLSRGVMELQNILDSGIDIRLECPELMKLDSLARESAPPAEPEPAAEEPVPEETPALEPAPDYAQLWGGKWYGWGVYYKAGGRFAELEDQAWDAVAQIDVDGDRGYLDLWDVTNLEEPELTARVEFAPGLTERGQMICESCTFLDLVYGRGFWVCEPGEAPESRLENTIVFHFTYADSENSADFLEVYYILRPWGMLWDDVREADTAGMIYEDMMPLLYEDWYLVQLQQEGGA